MTRGVDRTPPRAQPGPVLLKLVPIFAFLSGAAALTYESIWMRSFGLIFGVTTHALCVTLVTFMGGLALGSVVVSRLRVASALRAYAAVEAGIGLSALLTFLILRRLPAWYGALLQGRDLSAGLQTALRFAVSASVVLPPAILLGATFPLLVEVLSREGRRFHDSLGRLYLFNTLGGVAGVSLGAFFLLPAVGVGRTLLSAALANLLVGTAAFVAGRRLEAGRPEEAARTEGPASVSPLRDPGLPERRAALPAVFILIAAVTGGCSLGLEILWTRSLSLVIGSSIYAFNLMLIAFLTGIVLGTAVYRRLRPALDRPAPWLAAALGGMGALILIDLFAIGWLPLLFFNMMRFIPVSFEAHQIAGFLLCLLTMLPITTLFGFCFPLLVHLVVMERRTPREVSGLLYAWNTLGAIAGALVTSYLLVPATGLQASFVCMAALPLMAGLLVLAGERDWAVPLRVVSGTLFCLLMILLGALWRPWDLLMMTAGVYKYGPALVSAAPHGFFWLRDGFRESRQLPFYEEGQEAVVAVARSEGSNSILINGKSDGGTNRWDSATQKLLAHLPLLLHPDPHRALVIGWGTGGTAGTAALYPLNDLRVVEIEPAVFRAAPYFAEVNLGVDRDPRFRITFNDARTVLLTTAERYDVIISEPSNPWISGVSNLFTEDFYRIALPRLEEGGLFCQWFHYYNMSLEEIRTQARTFSNVFPHAALFVVPPSPPEEGPASVSGDLLLLGSRTPIVLDLLRVGRRFADERIAASLAAAGVRDPSDLLLDQVMDREDLRAFARDGARNTDDRPVIEFSAPLGLFLGTERSAEIYALLGASGREVVPRLVNDPALRGPAGRIERAGEYVRLAALLQRKAMLERATRLLGEALALDPRSAAARAALGEIRYVRGDRDQAEGMLTQAIREKPELKRPYEILGFLYYDRRDLAAAQRMFDQLVRRFPDDAPGYYGQALLEAEAKRWDRSRERLRKALSLQPSLDQARQLLEYVDRQSASLPQQ